MAFTDAMMNDDDGRAAAGQAAAPHTAGHHPDVPVRTFVMVWVWLLILTTATVVASVAWPGAIGIAVAVIVTPAKASLILLYFMHLRYEHIVFRLMFLVAALTLAIFLALTYFDYEYR